MGRSDLSAWRLWVIDSRRPRQLAYRLLSSAWLSHCLTYQEVYRLWIRHRQRHGLAHPETLSLETTNACNARCLMCGHRLMRRPVGFMSSELFHRILEQLSGWDLKTLYLSGFGEPLLDRKLPDKISLARSRTKAEIAIVTNGSLLTDEMAGRLSEAGLDRIHLSLDGANSEAFSRLRPGLDFRQVLDNIEGLLARPRRPRVIMQVVMVDQSPADMEEIERRFGRRVDRLTFRQAQDWAGRVELKVRAYSPHLSSASAWPPCRYLWDQLNIYWDGTVPSCCLDYEARQPLGNANVQSLEDIWQGARLQAVRQKHNTGRRHQLPLCRHCRYFSVWW